MVDGKSSGCCARCHVFEGHTEAKGYNLLQISKATIVISNIFLSASLIRLASGAAGCGETRGADCEETIYGFRPSSLVTNIYTISGLLSAFLLPWIGAVVDYTSHRKHVGVASAVVLVCLQTAQIFTLPSTWFPMAVLQAIAGFSYMVQVVTNQAYLPDLGKLIGEELMSKFTAIFYGSNFAGQVGFLLVIVALQMTLKLDDVFTAHVSQAMNVVIILLLFFWGWKCMPVAPPSRTLEEGKSLFLEGFKQTFRTALAINKDFGGGMRWFFLSVLFSNAGANGLIAVEVPFMVEVLDFTGAQVGLVNLAILVCAIPGSFFSNFVARKTNPKINYILSNALFVIVTATGGFVLKSEDQANLAYVWGVLWGFLLGWFWPGELLIYSLIVPKGQNAELSGFYAYVGQLLAWLPALLFTLMNEAGVGMNYGLVMVAAFFAVAIGMLLLMDKWHHIVNVADAAGDTTNDEELAVKEAAGADAAGGKGMEDVML